MGTRRARAEVGRTAEGSASDEADAARGGSAADDEPAIDTVTITLDGREVAAG